MYAQVASVVKTGGLLSTKQNVFIGLGIPGFIILFNMCFEYENYGGEYHCWLQMDKGDYSRKGSTYLVSVFCFQA